MRRNIGIIGLILALIIGSGALTPALSSPILLAEVSGNSTGSQTAAGLLGATATDAVLLFGYGFNSFTGGTQPLGLDIDLLLGADLHWANGSSGSYDFNSANSTDFLGIVGKLTNGTDEDLLTGGLVLLTGVPASFTGSVGAGPESGRIGGTPDLQGYSIDFIRLVVDDVFFSATSFDTVGTVEHDITARWQIWGTPVPEPSTMLLLGSGLIGLGAFRKKCRKK